VAATTRDGDDLPVSVVVLSALVLAGAVCALTAAARARSASDTGR
jgi:hypothetical protein